MRTFPRQTARIEFSYDDVCEILESHARDLFKENQGEFDFDEFFDVDEVHADGGNITFYVI